jgi:hypothetical protein
VLCLLTGCADADLASADYPESAAYAQQSHTGEMPATQQRRASVHAGAHALDAGAPGAVDAGGVLSHGDAASGHVHRDAGHAEEVLCPADYPAFRPGMMASVGDLTVRVLGADPTPPRQLVDNDWTIEIVSAASGMPLPDLTVLSADSLMTLHGHGGRWQPTIEPQDSPGRFVLRGIDFKMRGPWAVSLIVRSSVSARPVQAGIKICVE